MEFLHPFGDFWFDVLLAGMWLSRWVWVELFSSGDGWLVDPVSADGFAEDVESGLVVFGDNVGVVCVASAGEWCVDASAVG